MATIQQFKLRGNGSSGFINEVYTIIRNKSGRVTSKDLNQIIGNKQDVRLAITRLTVQGKIKRVRGFGKLGIEYFYKDVDRQQQKTTRNKHSTSASSYR
jgi:DNA-binding transcriptional regulator PaaX